MKRTHALVAFALVTNALLYSQSWKDLSKEQKMAKAQEFRADNQKYLKETLAMSPEQLEDIDNVNICFLSSIDRIDRYGTTAEGKEKYAKAATAARSAQLDAIMGAEKRKKFQDYVSGKLKKAGVIK